MAKSESREERRRGGGAGEAEDVEFGGVDVDAEELGVEVGLGGVVDAFD